MNLRGMVALFTVTLCLGIFTAMLTSNDISLGGVSNPMVEGGDCTTDEGRATDNNTSKISDVGLNHIRVEGTTIDLDLAQATQPTGNTFYLTHGVDGKRSSTGCPFIDWRCQGNCRNLIVYGHSFGMGQGGFTELRNAWEQTDFGVLGRAIITINGNTTNYYPLFAMRVDKGYREIQRFSFSNDAEFDTWLQRLKKSATARSNADEEHASRTLTLITCSSVRPGQRERTLVVFRNLN